MNYRSISTLNRQIIGWLPDLPRDIDLIVGVPRSGLLVGNILALHLNLPLTDVEGLIAGRAFSPGRRGQAVDFKRPLNVLVVDDSVRSGDEMNRVRRRIAEARLPHAVRYAAPYVLAGSESAVDFYVEAVGVPRVFEWNVMHHTVLLSSCVDIDGVLCADPLEHENDDGERYVEFLNCAKPLIIPSVPIGWLVTSRLEKYRDHTERWLKANGVQYRELVMLDLSTRAERVAAGAHGTYKANVYRETGADLFIESSMPLAVEIAELSGRPVFCAETREMISPERRPEPSVSNASAQGVFYKTAAAGPAPSGWTDRLQSAVRQVLQLVPPGRGFVLVDQEQWGMGDSFAGRRKIPFPEAEGLFAGPPADDEQALRELARLRGVDADVLVIGWPAYWWLEHYPRFAAELARRFPCTVRNELVTVYDLRNEHATT